MDAIVFFIAAMAASTILLSYVPFQDALTDVSSDDSDPSAILDVFLRTSVGQRLVLELDQEVFVDSSDDAALCVVLEAAAIKAGASPDAFSELNALLERMLRTICSAALEPHFVLLDLGAPDASTIMSLGGHPGDSPDSYASSCELFLGDGTECLAELVLVPAPPPE
jgi:hypothetical protein